jgi:ParB family chromosome partitioning protein
MKEPQECVVNANPFRCRMWALHDRLDDYITEASCRTEIESFAKHGQLVTVLARRVTDDPDYDFELIFGARRLFVARYLNKPLKIEVRTLTDLEAIIAMDVENHHRRDLSPYERGRSFAQWLRAGYFGSQDDVARILGISASQVSRLIKMSHLPAVVVAAFATPLEIREGWGLELVNACEDPRRRRLVVSRARAIAEQAVRPAAREIFEQLVGAVPLPLRMQTRRHDEVVRGSSGAPLFRVRKQRNAIALVVPTGNLSSATLMRITRALSDVLQEAQLQSADFGQPASTAGTHTEILSAISIA